MRSLARLLAALLAVPLAALQVAALEKCSHSSEPRCRTRQRRHVDQKRECTNLVHQYMVEHTADFDAPYNVSKLVFFLHVPRTAGKTYANCFLRTAIPPSKRCAKSYDVLRLNVSAPDCQALVSHDDFSISQFFPEGAATITQLRRPVDRILSSYEFAVDVAAKGVLHQARPRKNPKRRADFVGTLEVWPWSLLVPWFKRDMADRMERLRLATLQDGSAWRSYTSPDNRTYYWNEAKNKSVWTLPDPDPVLDPYNNSLVMPLHEFIEHPIAEELLHNGATLQVLGITNYSYWQSAEELRRCVRSNSIAREMLLTLASRRLKRMAHVGLTERLDESVLSMAADLGLGLDGPAYKYTSASAFTYDAGAVSDDDQLTFVSLAEGNVSLTVARSEAAERVKRIIEDQRELRRQLDDMTDRLNGLVDEEARWLAEQDAQQAAGGAQQQAAEQSVQEMGADAVLIDAAAPGQGGKGREACENSSSACSARQGPSGIGSRQESVGDESGEVLDGNTEVADEGQPGGEGGIDTQVEEGGGGASGSSGPAEGSGEQKPQGGVEGDEEYEEIDSPWAKEIVALDGAVVVAQQRMRQLDRELVALQNSGLVVSADEAKGRARQLIADEHYLLRNETLGQAYVRCAMAGKGRREKKKVYKHLRTPWGQTFQFDSQSRARLSPQLLSRIHQLNALDEELWKAGHALLEKKLEEQRAAGLLPSLPPFVSPHRRAQQQQQQQAYGGTAAKRRKLQSTGQIERGKAGAANEPSIPDSGAELHAQDKAEAEAGAAKAAATEAQETAVNGARTAANNATGSAEDAAASPAADAVLNASTDTAAHDEL